MAGVRNYQKVEPVAPPRGLPSDAGLHANWDAYRHIGNGDEDVSEDKAKEWVARGRAKWRDTKQRAVTNPDHHSHSWLTLEEFQRCLTPDEGVEWMAVAAAMKALESREGYESRIVFWFDN